MPFLTRYINCKWNNEVSLIAARHSYQDCFCQNATIPACRSRPLSDIPYFGERPEVYFTDSIAVLLALYFRLSSRKAWVATIEVCVAG